MRKLPPQRMAFPESPDLFQFSLQFERGGGGGHLGRSVGFVLNWSGLCSY